MDQAWDVLAFLGKALIVFVTFAACVGFFLSRVRARRPHEPYVTVREVSRRWRENAEAIQDGLAEKKRGRFVRRPRRPAAAPPPARVFVIDFKGDVLASETEGLREEITIVLGIAQPGDEVVVRLESSGGAVHGYGLAASQLARLRARQVPLTVCVDKVAASGGYMMACVGQQILAAPFAVIGSIGVVAPVPNLHRLLERHGVDYEDVTAGKYKRPVSLFGSVTEEGKQKLRDQIDETHVLFKRFVSDMRPKLDVEGVATGEHWYGARAIDLGLVDALSTSDDYLLDKSRSARILEVKCERPRPLRERAVSMAKAAFAAFL
jgi:serine protease SohB